MTLGSSSGKHYRPQPFNTTQYILTNYRYAEGNYELTEYFVVSTNVPCVLEKVFCCFFEAAVASCRDQHDPLKTNILHSEIFKETTHNVHVYQLSIND